MLLFFYAFFAIGFFPSYWSFIRDLKERIGIVAMNSSVIIVLFAIINLIDNLPSSLEINENSKEQIENEKSIILQEANMYKEEPNHLLNKKRYS